MAAAPKTAVAKKATTGTNVVSLKDQLAAQAAAMAGRVTAPSGDMISVTQDKQFKLPDGTKSAGPIEAIVVDFVAANYFYEGAYDPNNIVPPACFAINAIAGELVPSDNSPVKQADECSKCPMNQFGSDGKGKACKNSRVLAILAPDADVETSLAVLKISPTAIKAFDSYVSTVARSFQTPPLGVVTEISFDPASTYASLRFKALGPATDEQIELALSRQDEARQRLAVEPDVSTYESPKPKAAAGRRR